MRAPRGDLSPKITTGYVGMLWCLRGVYQDETEEEGTYTVRPGEFGVIFPGKTLTMRALEDGTEVRYLIFDGESAVQECLSAGLWEGVFRDSAPPFDVLDQIARRLRSSKPQDLSLAAGSVRDLLLVSADHARQAAKDKLIHQARRLMHTRYGEEGFGIPRVQETLGISRTLLNVRFKAETDVSPHAYLLNLRVREACGLLAGTERTVADIAQQCGFADPVYFSQLIRKRTGCSPRAYRKRSD